MTGDDFWSLTLELMRADEGAPARSRKAATEARERVQARLGGAPLEAVDEALQSAESRRPSSPRDRAAWRIAFEEALLCVGRRRPESFLAAITPRLGDRAVRIVLYAVVGSLHHPAGREVLRPAVDAAAALSEEEQVELASALWELGGSGALLRRLASVVPAQNAEAQTEIQDALAWLTEHDALGPTDDQPGESS